MISRDAAPVVCYHHLQRRTVMHEVERAGAGVSLCVTDNVCECLLNYAVDGNLDGGGQRWQRLRSLDSDAQAGPLVVGRLSTDSADEAQVIERRWAKGVDETADIGDSGLCLSDNALQQFLGPRDVGAQQIAGGLGLEGECGESRPQAIVEIAAQAASLLFAGCH